MTASKRIVIGAAVVVGLLYFLWRLFPESIFQLAPDSRLPKWFESPSGMTRDQLSVTMTYYISPFGATSEFTMRGPKGNTLREVSGKNRGNEPVHLKMQQPGIGQGYPAYEIITVNGVTDIIEHRRMEPIFYVTDDPEVWAELGVKR
jgi:hypothetical protein